MKRSLRGVVRFLGAIMAVTGVLLIADAAVTVAWQEPVSALLAGRAQDRLDDALVLRERRYAPVAGRRRGPAEPRRLAVRYRRGLRRGDPIGRIELPSLRRRYVLVEGTDPATLRQGPAHYPDTALPGMGRTVAVAGHRTTYLAPFRTIDRLRRGEPIVVRLPYGRFVYTVDRSRVVSPTSTWVIRDVGEERLVLTACHPLYSAKQRIVVFARLTRAAPAAPLTSSSAQVSGRRLVRILSRAARTLKRRTALNRPQTIGRGRGPGGRRR